MTSHMLTNEARIEGMHTHMMPENTSMVDHVYTYHWVYVALKLLSCDFILVIATRRIMLSIITLYKRMNGVG